MSAPKSVIHYDPSVEWESFQGTPVSSEISKDIIYKKWSVFLCACLISPPFIYLCVRQTSSDRSCARQQDIVMKEISVLMKLMVYMGETDMKQAYK